MATIKDSKAQNLASRIMSEVDTLMGAVYRLQGLIEEKTKAGLDFKAFDFSESSLKHAEGVDFDQAVFSFDAMKEFIDTNDHSKHFNIIRP